MNSALYHLAAGLCCVAGSQLACGVLHAKPMTYELSGTVEIIWTDGPVRGSVPPEIQFPLFTEESTWSATIKLDADESAYDQIRTSDGVTGYISSPGPPMDITVNLHHAEGGGAYTFSVPSTGDLEFWVGNDIPDRTVPPFPNIIPGGDLLTISSWVDSGLDHLPWKRQFAILHLRDSTATAFSEETIPESLDIDDFDDNSFNISFTTADGYALKHIQLFVDDISVVSAPEPSGAALLLLGGLAVLLRRRRLTR
jgi:hypothetical protein